MANTYLNTDWSADALTKATATSSTVDNVALGGTLAVTGATQLNSTLTVGADADGTDRSVTFGHSTLKCIMGIDDSADAFVINTDAAFDGTLANNSLSIDASHNIITAGDLTIAGLYKGYTPYIKNITFSDSNLDAVFIPFVYIYEETTPDSNDGVNRICMPYAGYLDKIVFRCQTTADTIDFEIYKAVSGTDADDADQNKLSSTVTVEDGTAHTLVTATFGTNYSFAVGDVLAVKMTYESSPGDIDMSLVFQVLVA